MINCLKLGWSFSLFASLCFLCLPTQSLKSGKMGLQERFDVPFKATEPSKSVSLKAPAELELPQILADFEQYAVQAMDDWKIPGMAIAIVQNDEIIYSKSFGVKKLGESDPVTTDTVFQIGSASKAFTSLLVAMMVEEGYFSWTDSVVSLLPDFTLYDPWVTREFQVRDMMSQHSGLPAYSGMMGPLFDFDRNHTRFLQRYIKPVTSFRSEFAYQNTLFLDAAALLEKVTGKTWEQLLQEQIFTPLGMTTASSTLNTLLASPDRTLGHYRMENWYRGEILPVQPDWPFIDWVYTYGPAGSIACSITDLTKWVRFQLNQGEFENQRLIRENALEYLHKPHTIVYAPVSGTQFFYAQGWLYQTEDPSPIVWHNGGTLSGTSMVSFIPEANLGFVLVANLRNASIGDTLHLAFYDRYFQKENLIDRNGLYMESLEAEIAEQQPPKLPQNPSPPPDLDSLAGHYANSYFGTVSVIHNENAGELLLTIGPQQQPVILTPWDGNAFMTSIPKFMDYADFTVFHLDSNGVAQSMSVETLNSDADFGEFTRIEDPSSDIPWFPQTIVNQLDALVDKEMQAGKVPGAVVGVWVPGRGKYLAARGLANIETNEPRTLEDPFRIGSITKTFTATVVLQLIQEGLLDYSTPLSNFFPDFHNADKITISDLMRMKSGIPDYTTEEFDYFTYNNILKLFPLNTLLAPIYDRTDEFETPGEKVIYCNTNFILLESIVEKVTGSSLADEIANRITTPLGLQHTFYPTDIFLPGNNRGYDENLETGQWIDHTEISPSFSGGAGAMISNLYDLKSFVKVLYEGDLLPPEIQISRLQADSFFETPEWIRYGEGIINQAVFWGHSGSINGFCSSMYYYPQKNTTIIINYNAGIYAPANLFMDITATLFPDDVPWASKETTNVANWQYISN